MIGEMILKLRKREYYHFCKKNYCQQPFGKIANFVVNSRLRFARNIILVENKQFRTSQLLEAAER
jgi:hypothetical protein